MKNSTSVGMVVLLGMALSAPVIAQQPAQKPIQCWTDKNGQRMCGDRLPPEYAGQRRDIILDGRVVETKKPSKTAEELAEEERKKKEAEERQRRADYDRALLETYRSAKDIEAMRDERLILLDSRIASTEKNAGDTDRSLEGLRARAAAAEKEGKPVEPRLAKQIKEFEKSHDQNVRALQRYRAERVDIETKFNRDLARYHELRGTTPPPAPAPAAPADAASAAAPAPEKDAPPATAPTAMPAPEKKPGG